MCRVRSQISVWWARATTLTAAACSLSPATARSWCRSERTMSARACASAASLLAPEVEYRSLNRDTCRGLIACTWYPAATSAATHGPRSVSIPITTSAASPLPRCAPISSCSPAIPATPSGSRRAASLRPASSCTSTSWWSDSPGALPSRGLLRTARATFAAGSSSKPRGRAGLLCWVPALAGLEPAGAGGVNQAGRASVVGGPCALDHDVPVDAGPGELHQVAAAFAVAEDPVVVPELAELAEVPADDPALRLVRVAVCRPLVSELPYVVIQGREHLGRHHRPIVGRPAPGDWGEPDDDRHRVRAAQCARLGREPFPDPPDGRFAWFDQ